jgi:copper resistance protein B
MMSIRAVATVVLASTIATGSAHGQEMDNMVFHFSQLEVDASRVEGSRLNRWDGSGWIGTDFDRLWWSTEGGQAGGTLGGAEAMVLYGHYVRRFWDVVIGYRQDIEPTAQGYLAFGVAGLAPYWFEVGAFGFISQEGRPSVRLEADTDLFLTQRLVLTLGGELDWLLTDDDRLGLENGIAELEIGLRTRYEIRRKFAPYLDLLWVREKESVGTPDLSSITESGLRVGIGVRLIY